MTTMDDHQSKRSILRRVLTLLLVAVAIGCVPALWLVGRDMVGLLLASSPEQKEDMEAVIIQGLVHELDRARSVDEAGSRPLATRVINQSCYAVRASAIRQDVQFQPSPLSKDGRYGDDQLFYQMASVAISARRQSDSDLDKINVAATYDPLAASLLRSCIAATPFSGVCRSHAGRSIDRNLEQTNQRLVEWGILIPIKSSPGDPVKRYCDTLPFRLDIEPQ